MRFVINDPLFVKMRPRRRQRADYERRGTEAGGFALHYRARAAVNMAATHVHRVNGLHAALAQLHARISTAKQSLRCACVRLRRRNRLSVNNIQVVCYVSALVQLHRCVHGCVGMGEGLLLWKRSTGNAD